MCQDRPAAGALAGSTHDSAIEIATDAAALTTEGAETAATLTEATS